MKFIFICAASNVKKRLRTHFREYISLKKFQRCSFLAPLICFETPSAERQGPLESDKAAKIKKKLLSADTQELQVRRRHTREMKTKASLEST
jgi:hypothetical protein